jgi:hypothetical protein
MDTGRALMLALAAAVLLWLLLRGFGAFGAFGAPGAFGAIGAFGAPGAFGAVRPMDPHGACGHKRTSGPEVPLTDSSRIFVSVASYRDKLCSATLDSMFANAKFPERVFAGVYEQNADASESCVQRKNVRVVTVHASKASGPCTARYECARLLRDEEIFLQIDSHTEFARDWDVHAVAMLREVPGASAGLAVISTYPVNCEPGWADSDPPVIDRAKFGTWLTFEATIRADAKTKNVPSRQIGGGFLLCVADVVRKVPYDPGLAGTHNGEEILYSARLFTHGIDVVAPRQNLVCHQYTYADHKTVWDDRPDWSRGAPGPARVDAILRGTLPDLYGDHALGAERSLDDFWRHVAIDYENKTVGPWT